MKGAFLFVSAWVVLAIRPAWAIDDRFNPASYEKGGFAPVTEALYAKECGGCHFAYLPGTLPARSWKRLLENANDHFGEALSLPAEAVRQLEAYLVANAADRSWYRGSEAILYRLADEVTPVRVTLLPVMRQRHYIVQNVMAINPKATVKKLTNCNDCHERAAAGSFAYGEILVPGISKVVRPGGMF